jgi:GNAT superfamily N-acetyltransferase
VSGADSYSAFETLRDGRRVEIRALKPEDRQAMIAAVDRASAQSLYRRFFAAKRTFSDREADFFVNIDFVNHVALLAVADEGGKPAIAGAGRYIVVRAGVAELAFTVIDEYQGKGLGSALMRHLILVAIASGLSELIAEVLPENRPMLRLFEKIGGHARRERGVVHVTLDLAQKS